MNSAASFADDRFLRRRFRLLIALIAGLVLLLGLAAIAVVAQAGISLVEAFLVPALLVALFSLRFVHRLERRLSVKKEEIERVTKSLRAESEARRRALEALRESEAQFRDAQRVARVGSWGWDIVGGSVTWSDELYRTFGQESGSFQPSYERYMVSVHPEDRERVASVLQRALTEGSCTYDTRIVRPDGEVRVICAKARVDYDDSGRPLKMVGTAQDVTEEHEMERVRRASVRQPETGSGFDLELVRSRFSDRLELFEELADLFVGYAPGVLEEGRAALGAEDRDGIGQSAHALKGSLSFFGESPALAATGEVEREAPTAELADLAQSWERMERSVEEVIETFARMESSSVSPVHGPGSVAPADAGIGAEAS